MKKIYVATDLVENQNIEEYVPQSYTNEQIITFLNKKYGQNGWLVYDFKPLNHLEVYKNIIQKKLYKMKIIDNYINEFDSLNELINALIELKEIILTTKKSKALNYLKHLQTFGTRVFYYDIIKYNKNTYFQLHEVLFD